MNQMLSEDFNLIYQPSYQPGGAWLNGHPYDVLDALDFDPGNLLVPGPDYTDSYMMPAPYFTSRHVLDSEMPGLPEEAVGRVVMGFVTGSEIEFWAFDDEDVDRQMLE